MTMSEQIPQILHPDDEAAVHALYASLMDGWNKGSAEAFAKPFVYDGHLVAFDGTHFRNRDAIITFHQPLFNKWLRGTRLVGEITSVRFLNPNVALMHARGSTVMRGQLRPSPERDSIQTMVAIKQDSKWRLLAFQNTRVRPMAQNTGTALFWLFTDWLWKVVALCSFRR